jgi:hypothetical protein
LFETKQQETPKSNIVLYTDEVSSVTPSVQSSALVITGHQKRYLVKTILKVKTLLHM